MPQDPLQDSLEDSKKKCFLASGECLTDQEIRLKIWELQRLFSAKF